MSFSSIESSAAFKDAKLRPPPSLAIVVPCYNEEDALPFLLQRLEQLDSELMKSGMILAPLELLLIDDGSTDKTWTLIEGANTSLQVKGVRLSRNFGHQHALYAGLIQADADVVVSMDADLQDDPSAIVEMLAAYARGADVVYGVRGCRATDTWFKRWSAQKYYGLLSSMGVDLIPDHADFRLMSRKALSALSEFGETNLFLRGLVRQVGFASETVTYDRPKRTAGESKYPLHKMIALALEGITSFSIRPLRMITMLGFLIAGNAFIFAAYSILAWMLGKTIPGWTSTVVPIYMLGGLHLVALGVIGEYVGKIYQETKGRPRFIIDKTVTSGAVTAPISIAHAKASMTSR
ncbi:glycosyltransferase family 2 protein [Thalassorhabdomicrobium marinisediminis]|uniref:glycosyltransferase family 2 protein n=1 Tax=Thalassorhabdomicrobium marinisediminis TaxID=2170577 RepID=UPI0024909091|nr:glycosyltransferase family 2 protein [Thalassorhabdomicrobium marinisediminis]